VGSGTTPPTPPELYQPGGCPDPNYISPGNPFPTSVGAFQTTHAASRVDSTVDSRYRDCNGPSSPGWTDPAPDCRNTPIPARPNEDGFIVMIKG
jgi:hypothetical protein